MEQRYSHTGRLEIPQERQQKWRSDEIGRIFQAMRECMKRSNKETKRFMIYSDIKAIWTTSRISTILWRASPDPATIQFVQKNMIMMLSCLIYIRSTDWLHEFLERLWDGPNKRWLLTDDDIPIDEDKLVFLPDDAAREAFYKAQHIFKPLVIELSSVQCTQTISEDWRLPFEHREKDVGSGGYGVVDRVAIPPGYIRNEEGMAYDRHYVVACKKFRKTEDFIKEKENIEILKESFTRHGNILLHLGTIEHGLHQYILLPYADLGDLEEFLNGGVVNGKAQYDFNSRFSKLSMVDVPIPLLTQCVGIADALNWLHSNITLSNGNSNISCVHMDLKPSNILIMKDERSTVGKWKISDFGISVWRSRGSRNDPKVISVGDYVRRGETVNTRPKRHEGTYQAPEVKQSEPTINQVSPLTEDQKGIGRKSDVWSFGCIAAEVLAFALGGAQHVQTFGQARRGNNRENDYFYEELRDRSSITTTYLTVNRPPQPIGSFQVRRAVVQWLNKVDNDASSPQRWINCFVGTIKRILIVDLSNRPSSQDLLNLVKHVREHISSSKVEAVHCKILSQPSEASYVPPSHLQPSRSATRPVAPFGQHAYDVPDIFGSISSNNLSGQSRGDTLPQSTPVSPSFSSVSSFHDKQQRHSDPNGKRPIPGMDWSHEGFAFTQQTSPRAQNLAQRSAENEENTKYEPGQRLPFGTQRDSYTVGPQSRFSKHDAIPEDALSQHSETSGAPSRTGSGRGQMNHSVGSPPRTIGSRESHLSPTRSERSSQLSRNVSVFGYATPENLHGLLINFEMSRSVRRKPETQTITSSSKSFNTKATAVSVNLLKHDFFDVAYLVHNTVHLFRANITQRGIAASREFTLPESRGWSNIALGGDFVAVWGHTPGVGKLIHICDVTAPSNRVSLDSRINLSTLKKVAVSQHGIAALLCHGTIVIVTIEDIPIVVHLSGAREQAFTDIAFNEDANLLFAWAFGSQKDSLYVWRCEKRVVIEEAEVKSHYSKDTNSNATHTKIIPYNTYEGCLVHPPSKQIFPAQTGGSLAEPENLHHRTNHVLLSDVQTGVMYQNHSLITIEKKAFHRRPLLREYQIEYKPTHLLQADGKDIAKLGSKCDAHSAIQIIPAAAHDDGSVSIIIYNLDRTAEWVKFEPT